LRDESAQIRKLALSILSQVLVKYSQKDSLNASELSALFMKQKF